MQERLLLLERASSGETTGDRQHPDSRLSHPGEEENWTDQLVPNDVTTPNISGRSITQALDKKNYAGTLNK
jgi:hypothetical protein